MYVFSTASKHGTLNSFRVAQNTEANRMKQNQNHHKIKKKKSKINKEHNWPIKKIKVYVRLKILSSQEEIFNFNLM